jgi:hypothetical protein
MQTIENLSTPSLKVAPALHGTSAANLDSIYQRGLLVPGQGNELQVVNGAAHGTGVYTANLNASWLSAGFCSGPKMLVCAVLETSEVRHVQDAQVVANSAHVVPLFLGVGSELRKNVSAKAELPKSVPVSWLLQFKLFTEQNKFGHTIEDFHRAGYVAGVLRWAGYTAAELEMYYTASDLYGAGYGVLELMQSGYTLTDLQQSGCPGDKLPVAELIQLGYNLVDFLHARVPAAHLKEHGATMADLQGAGYTLTEMHWSCGRGFTAADFKEAGFAARELQWVCTLFELKSAGYTAFDLSVAGHTSSALKGVGFSESELNAAEIRAAIETPADDDIDDDDL